MRFNYIITKICLKSLGLETFNNNYIAIAKSSCSQFSKIIFRMSSNIVLNHCDTPRLSKITVKSDINEKRIRSFVLKNLSV